MQSLGSATVADAAAFDLFGPGDPQQLTRDCKRDCGPQVRPCRRLRAAVRVPHPRNGTLCRLAAGPRDEMEAACTTAERRVPLVDRAIEATSTR